MPRTGQGIRVEAQVRAGGLAVVQRPGSLREFRVLLTGAHWQAGRPSQTEPSAESGQPAGPGPARPATVTVTLVGSTTSSSWLDLPLH